METASLEKFSRPDDKCLHYFHSYRFFIFLRLSFPRDLSKKEKY